MNNIIAKNVSEYNNINIFDNMITYYFYGWQITDNGNYLYNNGNEEQPFLVYDTKTKKMIELAYPKKLETEYQYILFTAKYLIYNNYDKIIIEDYNNKIIKIIHNYVITNLIKNDKYLFATNKNSEIKVYDLETFELIFSSYFNTFGLICYNNKYLITGWNDINIYDLDENKLYSTFKIKNNIRGIAINENHIACLVCNYIISIYNLYGNHLYDIYQYNHNEFQYLNYSYDNKYLYYGNSYELVIFETDNYNIIKKYNLDNISSYCLTNDNYKILYINNVLLGTIYTPQFYNVIYDLTMDYLPVELINKIMIYL